MPNRIIRAELLESEAWLSLKDNADRSAWVACFLTVDNFGNMPAGPHRLVKLWRPYGIDSPEKAAKTKLDLADVDLIRAYVVDGKPYLHIPRFGQECKYLGHLWPLSPWTTDKQKQRLGQKTPANLGESPETASEPLPDVDVDVNKTMRDNSRKKSKPVDNFPPRPGESQAQYEARLRKVRP